MKLTDRIQEHLSMLGPIAGDTDTAWLLREAAAELRCIEKRVVMWEPSLMTQSGGVVYSSRPACNSD